MMGVSNPWFDNNLSREGLRNSFIKKRKISWLRLIFGDLNINWKFILLNIVFFIIVFLLGFFKTPSCEETICRVIAIQPASFFESGYVWTLLTSMFMHGGFVHLLINMFVLFSLGNLCEQIIGRKRFFWFYLLSGVFAGLLYVFLAYFFGIGLLEKVFGSPLTYAVGASGAIFAIAGLFVVLTPKLKFYLIFLPFWGLPAYIMVPLILFLTWIVSFSTGLPVGNVAHLGGFLAGILYGYILKLKYKRKTKMINELFSD